VAARRSVVPGYFSQTNERPGLAGNRLLAVLASRDLPRGPAMAALRRYELHGCAEQPFETLSGGQQARLQILPLELDGATLLLLDEPTDNLDLASAEALEDALETFEGTVLAVTHDAGSCAVSTASSSSSATAACARPTPTRCWPVASASAA